MSHRRFLAIYAALFLSGIAAVAGFNWWMDPLWCFSHGHRFNQRQFGFDERQQKINRIEFGTFDYDAILLGSSRSTYIDQHDFPGSKVFNLAVSGMRPDEYGAYLDLARRRLGKDLPTVFIGIDFFGTNRNYGGRANPAAQYMATAEAPLYRFEALVGLELLGKSAENFEARNGECDCYDRENVKHMVMPPERDKAAVLAKDLAAYREHIYGSDYAYDTELPTIWRELRQRNPRTRFVVFTTPTSQPLFLLLARSGRLPDLERWLRQAVAEFGAVHDFMGINPVTANLDNYQDGGHFTPAVGRLLAQKVSGTEVAPKDFGVLVTADNLERHLADLRRQAVAADGLEEARR